MISPKVAGELVAGAETMVCKVALADLRLCAAALIARLSASRLAYSGCEDARKQRERDAAGAAYEFERLIVALAEQHDRGQP